MTEIQNSPALPPGHTAGARRIAHVDIVVVWGICVLDIRYCLGFRI